MRHARPTIQTFGVRSVSPSSVPYRDMGKGDTKYVIQVINHLWYACRIRPNQPHIKADIGTNLPEVASWLLYRAVESLPEVCRVGHSAQDPCPPRCMRVKVDAFDGSLLGALSTPPIGIVDEEQLLIGEKLKAW